MCLSQLQGLASNPWHSLGYNCITTISASVFTWHASCVSLSEFLLARAPIIGFGPTIIQYDLLSIYLHLQKSWSQIRPQSQVPVRHDFWGHTVQPSLGSRIGICYSLLFSIKEQCWYWRYSKRRWNIYLLWSCPEATLPLPLSLTLLRPSVRKHLITYLKLALCWDYRCETQFKELSLLNIFLIK